jgi:hypothetical protein
MAGMKEHKTRNILAYYREKRIVEKICFCQMRLRDINQEPP